MSYAAINQAAISHHLPEQWFPQAKKRGQSLRLGSLSGEPGSSLWICLRSGRWKDHATGESGGDLISLYAHKEGITHGEARSYISNVLGTTANPAIKRATNRSLNEEQKIELALKIWDESKNIFDTPGLRYFEKRGLKVPTNAPLRFNPFCVRGKDKLPAVIALITDIHTNKPCGIHRTYIKADGSGKVESQPQKAMLGRSKNGVVRLTPHYEVTMGLGISEGIENGLAILGVGWAPIWATLSTSGMQEFPVLNGINAITIFADADDAGRNAARACAQNWANSGREAIIHTPRKEGADWNDEVMNG